MLSTNKMILFRSIINRSGMKQERQDFLGLFSKLLYLLA